VKVYSLTKTLDDYVDFYTDNKEEAEVLVVGGSDIKLNDFPNLKYIFKCGVGVDNIPFDEMEKKGVELVLPSQDTQDVIYDAVAKFTIHSILSAHFSRSYNFDKWEKNKRPILSDMSILVIGGRGNIGKRVVSLAHNFFEKVVVYDINMQTDLESELPYADIVTLHLPLNESTKDIIDLSLLKDDVILVNTSRGGLVKESDLWKFLSNNEKALAVFDVFWKEPYDGYLLSLDNFVATPHIASSTEKFFDFLYEDLLMLMG
jgi:phosphoglycerate dehydrogenase-like enzyme